MICVHAAAIAFALEIPNLYWESTQISTSANGKMGGGVHSPFRQHHRCNLLRYRFVKHTLGNIKCSRRFHLSTLGVNLVSSALQLVITVMQPLYLATRAFWVSSHTREWTHSRCHYILPLQSTNALYHCTLWLRCIIALELELQLQLQLHHHHHHHLHRTHIT